MRERGERDRQTDRQTVRQRKRKGTQLLRVGMHLGTACSELCSGFESDPNIGTSDHAYFAVHRDGLVTTARGERGIG